MASKRIPRLPKSATMSGAHAWKPRTRLNVRIQRASSGAPPACLPLEIFLMEPSRDWWSRGAGVVGDGVGLLDELLQIIVANEVRLAALAASRCSRVRTNRNSCMLSPLHNHDDEHHQY